MAMDSGIERSRRAARRRIDLLLGEAEGKLAKYPINKDDITVHWKVVEDEVATLHELDQQARDFLFEANVSDEVEDKEFQDAKDYRIKIEKTRLKVDKLFEVPIQPPLPVTSLTSVSGEAATDGMRLRLPKFDLPSFDGNLLSWLGYWAQFKKIDQATSLDGSDKFNYLLSSLVMGSKPYEDIIGMPASDENYKEAVDKLTKAYGNPDVLLQVYIRELLNLVISNVRGEEKLPITVLFTKVDSHLRALKSLKLDKADPAAWLYPLVESCLPHEWLTTWTRSTEYKEKGTEDKTRLDFC